MHTFQTLYFLSRVYEHFQFFVCPFEAMPRVASAADDEAAPVLAFTLPLSPSSGPHSWLNTYFPCLPCSQGQP